MNGGWGYGASPMLAIALSLALTAADGGVSNPPADFIDDVRLVFQVVTCQPVPVPAPLDAKTVEAWCQRMTPKFERFRTHWGVTAKDFVAAQRPAGLPGELVYPFGGGDLMMALTAFPEATTVTTLSLELAGDPRRLRTLADKKALEQSLKALDEAATTTLLSNDSKSVNLSKIQRGDLPGQLAMHLMGLALHDLEPVSVRFFRIEPDGALHYYSLDEIAALEGTKATKLKESWKAPDFSPAFANVEVQFVPKGQPQAPRRVHRHIGANLSDDGLAKMPGLLKHLDQKGRVSAMTKAASYLLWRDHFATIRDYLLRHMEFMVSDSTGIPPRFATKAGFEQQAFGKFNESFLGANPQYNEDFRKLWKTAKPLAFRYGYLDKGLSMHMLVTQKAKPAEPAKP